MRGRELLLASLALMAIACSLSASGTPLPAAATHMPPAGRVESALSTPAASPTRPSVSPTPRSTATPAMTPTPAVPPTPPISSIVAAMAPVAAGQGVPSAAAYDPARPGPHPAVLLSRSGGEFISGYNDPWNQYFPASGWFPASAEQAELVVIAAEREINLGSAHYDAGPDITRYRYDLDLEIREARTARTVVTYTITGPEPGPFPPSAPYDQTRVEGAHVMYHEAVARLCPHLEPTACWKVTSKWPRFTVADGANPVAFAPDGQTLATGTEGGQVYLLQLEAEYQEFYDMQANTSRINTVTYAPDGLILAAGSDDGAVRLWQISDRSLIRTLEGHAERVNSIAISPDGQMLASGSDDGTVRLWRFPDGDLIRTLKGHAGRVNGVAFSPDGRTLASGSADTTARLWQISNGALLRTLEAGVGVHSVAFSPDGQTLAAGMDNTTVGLWRIADGSLAGTLKAFDGQVLGVAFSPDGKTLAAATSLDSAVTLWRLADARRLHAFMNVDDWGSGAGSVAFSSDGSIVASGGLDGTVRLWRRY